MYEYCSSKFALQGLSQSLRIELRPLGIDLLMVSPGTTKTEFYDRVVHGRGEVPWNKGPGVPSATVARRTVRAIEKGKREIIPNVLGGLLVWANHRAPWIVDHFLNRYA
jgi:short-subunit dehydrogenase